MGRVLGQLLSAVTCNYLLVFILSINSERKLQIFIQEFSIMQNINHLDVFPGFLLLNINGREGMDGNVSPILVFDDEYYIHTVTSYLRGRLLII